MNSYINELSEMVPTCNENPKKPDKLTVLRMAVDHIKHLRAEPSYEQQTPKTKTSSFLSERELKLLVLEAAGGFLFVVNCVNGTLLYVSDSITPVLGQAQTEWENRTIYELIHPDDEKKIRDQLCVDAVDSGRILDLKTGSVRKETSSDASRMYTSSRRNFICRMKKGQCPTSSPKNTTTGLDNEYSVIHCTGFLRACAGGRVSNLVSISESSDPSTFCLIAIGRLQPTCSPVGTDLSNQKQVTEFISRIAVDGKFTFLDQSIQDVLGYSPKEILGQSCYEFIHPEDRENMRDSYDQVIKTKGQNLSVEFRFRNKRGTYVKIRTVCFSFQNPYTDEPEYIVCNNSLVRNKSHETDFQSISNNSPWSNAQTPMGLIDRVPNTSPGETFMPPEFFPRMAMSKRFPEMSQSAPIYMGGNAVPQYPGIGNFPSSSDDRAGQQRIPAMESTNYEFNPRKIDAMPSEKGGLSRFGLTSSSLDRPQYLPDESRLSQNPLQFRPSPSSTGELSEMQRLVPQASYLNNNVELNSLDRSIDVKPSLQHISAYEAQISSPNQMGINPAMMTSSAAGNRGYQYSNCNI
ncbi:aryl hydrocarbon receptor nuclear translocator-like isoform X2 [Dendronephthya gigantea]|nr:aryl hydrocarbon receptor nuclear translocator-like isoform X2 [Dendronephthya gigantea]